MSGFSTLIYWLDLAVEMYREAGVANGLPSGTQLNSLLRQYEVSIGAMSIAKQAKELGIEPSELIGYYIVRKAREKGTYSADLSDKEVEKRERSRIGHMSIAKQAKELGVPETEVVRTNVILKLRAEGMEGDDDALWKYNQRHTHDKTFAAETAFANGDELSRKQQGYLEGKANQTAGGIIRIFFGMMA